MADLDRLPGLVRGAIDAHIPDLTTAVRGHLPSRRAGGSARPRDAVDAQYGMR